MAHIDQKLAVQYQQRREQLQQLVTQEHGHNNGVIVLFGNFERPAVRFKQDATFLYYSGIRESGVALCIDVASGKTTVYIPQFAQDRAQWVSQVLTPSATCAQAYLVDDVIYMGQAQAGYSISVAAPLDAWNVLAEKLNAE